MKYLKQIMIILAAYLGGLALEHLLNIPLPAVVSGLILLFLGLLSGLVKKEMVEETCDFLLAHLPFLFLPAGAGLMTAADRLRGNILPFAVIIVASTAVVWLVTAYTVKLFRRIFK